MSKSPREQAGKASQVSPSETDSAGAVRLRGRTLVVARVICIALVAINLVTFLTSIPDLFAAVEQVCLQGCSFVPEQQKALADIGISMPAYATLVVAFAVVIALVSLAMGALVFWRRSDDWMALIIALFLAVTPTGNISALTPSSGPSANLLVIGLIALLLSLPLRAAYYGAFLVFPSGRFVPRWSWILLVAWVVFIVVFTLLGNTYEFLAIGYLVLYVCAIVSQVYRYRSVSNAVQRQQTKLVVVGFVASLLANQIFWQTNTVLRSSQRSTAPSRCSSIC